VCVGARGWAWTLDGKMSEPNVVQTIFMLFYAIFWGAVANAQPKWRAFNWPVALKYRRPRRRLAAAFLLMNLAPVVVFVAFFSTLACVTPESTSSWFWGGLQIFLAIVAAHAPFALHRLWIGTLEHEPTRYYYEVSEEPGLLPAFEPRLDSTGKEPHSVALSKDWSRGNLIASVLHLFVCAAAAIALNQGRAWQLVASFGVFVLLCAIVVWAWRK